MKNKFNIIPWAIGIGILIILIGFVSQDANMEKKDVPNKDTNSVTTEVAEPSIVDDSIMPIESNVSEPIVTPNKPSSDETSKVNPTKKHNPKPSIETIEQQINNNGTVNGEVNVRENSAPINLNFYTQPSDTTKK